MPNLPPNFRPRYGSANAGYDMGSAQTYPDMMSGGGEDANQFGPISPEQQAMLQRQAVQPSWSPLDFMPGPMTGFGAGLGALLYPMIRGGGGPRSAAAAPAGIGYGLDMLDRYRGQQPLPSQFYDNRDAEGQPGGFYGQNALAQYRNR